MQLRKRLATFFAAMTLAGGSVAAHAALTPIDVTWNPSGAGISSAGPFTFDNVVLNTYLTIDVSGTNFAEQGYLRMTTFTNNGVPVAIPNAGYPSGTPYSLYVSFNASGTQTAGTPSFGSFNSLTYTLLGAPGVTNFTDANNDGLFEVAGAAPVTLGTGSLMAPGSTSLTADPVTGLLLPAAQLVSTFTPSAAAAGFFVNPSALTPLNITAAFTSTGTVVSQITATRLRVDGGGGNATFALAAVPEPDTYGMLLAGLGLFAFVARRKKRDTA